MPRETATTTVYHQPPNGGYDCLSWGAIVFSTAVADVDGDGLPDKLETTAAGLKDPDGKDLPNLQKMGAGVDMKDLFIEINAMQADAGTSYGSPDAPYDSALGIPTVTVPMGTMADIGMPVGLTFAGRAYDDNTLLALAAAFEATGSRRTEPPRTPRL